LVISKIGTDLNKECLFFNYSDARERTDAIIPRHRISYRQLNKLLYAIACIRKNNEENFLHIGEHRCTRTVAERNALLTVSRANKFRSLSPPCTSILSDLMHRSYPSILTLRRDEIHYAHTILSGFSDKRIFILNDNANEDSV